MGFADSSQTKRIIRKGPFASVCREKYSKEATNLRSLIGHKDLYEEKGLFYGNNKLRPPKELWAEVIRKDYNAGH